jgi:hypothetical protein
VGRLALPHRLGTAYCSGRNERILVQVNLPTKLDLGYRTNGNLYFSFLGSHSLGGDRNEPLLGAYLYTCASRLRGFLHSGLRKWAATSSHYDSLDRKRAASSVHSYGDVFGFAHYGRSATGGLV